MTQSSKLATMQWRLPLDIEESRSLFIDNNIFCFIKVDLFIAYGLIKYD